MRKRSTDDNGPFAELARCFMAEHQVWPLFSHIRFESDDEASLATWWRRLVDVDPRWNYARMSGNFRDTYSVDSVGTTIVYCLDLFYVVNEDLMPGYFQEAMHCYSCLCRQLYRLSEPRFRPGHEPDKRSWPWLVMEKVYHFSRYEPRLQVTPRRYWNGEQLPDGVFAMKLPCGVFRAAAIMVKAIPDWSDIAEKAHREQRESGNKDRDEYCYKQFIAGVKLDAIKANLNQEIEQMGWDWDPLNTLESIRKAARRHAGRIGRLAPRRRARRKRRPRPE